MYQFRTNPPSRQIAPTPAFVRTKRPAHGGSGAADTSNGKARQASRPSEESGNRRDRNALLLERIRAHCVRQRLAFSAFGVRAASDPRLVFDLQQGRKPGKRLTGVIETLLREGASNA